MVDYSEAHKKFLRYYRCQSNNDALNEFIAGAIKESKKFEEYYLPAYGRLILTMYEMEQVLENCRTWKHEITFDFENTPQLPSEEIDIKLEKLTLNIYKHWFKVVTTRHQTENDILLLKLNKRKLDRRLFKITNQTHSILLSVVSYLAKRDAKQVILDCQIKEKTEGKIIIRCGICATQVLQVLIHRMQRKKKTKARL